MLTKEICATIAAMVLGLFSLSSCSSLSQQPASDAAAVRWQETGQVFAQGDIDETLRLADLQLSAPEPYRTKAAALKMLILAGKSAGYFELAEAHQLGAQENPGNVAAFHRATSTYRSRSRVASLALAQMVSDAGKYFGSVDSIPLDISLPAGSSTPSPIVASIKTGRMAQDSQAQAVEDYTIRRAVVLAICEAWGVDLDGDAAGGQLRADHRGIPKPRLLATVGKALYEQAELFARERLDDRDKRALLLDLSAELLQSAMHYQQQQEARLQSWEAELATRRSALWDESGAR
jgi:hypothetical protein